MSDGYLLLSMAVSLTLTLAIELAFTGAVGYRKELRLVALANLMTNPPLVALSLTCKYYLPAVFPFALAGLEPLAALLEGDAYRRYGGIKRPYLFSVAANALSFGLGLLIRT